MEIVDSETSMAKTQAVIDADPTKIMSDLFWLAEQSQQRCMFECSQWLAFWTFNSS